MSIILYLCHKANRIGMILINDNIEGIDLQESMGLLSEQRRDKVLAIKDIMAQKASVAAYILLCEGLRQEYGGRCLSHKSKYLKVTGYMNM